MRVTVVTSTIGRPELRQCIESVRAQTYAEVNHHVYVNGPRFHACAREILDQFPHVTAFYLPEETGTYDAMGPSCGGVFAGAPFLTSADWIFYLNDDDFYDPHHVGSVMALAQAHNLGWAYSLRRIVARDGSPIVDDDWCSLGHWPILGSQGVQHVVDNSCFALRRDLAERYGRSWAIRPTLGDRYLLMALKESGARAGCTGLSTVNYRTGTGSAEDRPEAYLESARQARATMSGGFPWRKAAVFPDYEFRVTEGQRKAWDGSPDLALEGWEEWKPWERFEYTEKRYWRRKLT